MYLSKVTVNRGPELFKILNSKIGSDGYKLHQLLWSLFPNDGSMKRDFLFSRDEGFDGLPTFMVMSKTKPEGNDALSVVTKEFNPTLAEGQELQFTLVANPVVARKTEGKRNSKKHDVWMDAKKSGKEKGLAGEELEQYCTEAAKEWLIRQGERTGFKINSEDIIVDGYLQNKFSKFRGGRPIRYSSIRYSGKLTVTDPDKFIIMLGEGLGKSKSFGCGLMLVRRA